MVVSDVKEKISNMLGSIGNRHTRTGYTAIWRKFFEQLDKSDSDTITSDDLDRFMVSVKQSGKKPSTIYMAIAGINKGVKYLSDRGYTLPKYETIKVHANMDKKIYTKQEIEFALSLCKVYEKDKPRVAFLKSRNALIIRLGQHGLRVEEMITIQLKHINITDRPNTITVYGKGNLKPRKVPITHALKLAIADYCDRHESYTDYLLSEKSEHHEPLTDDSLLLLNDELKPITTNGIRHVWATLFSEGTPHCMRATSATWLLQQGLTYAQIMKAFGWEQVETAKRYDYSASELDTSARDKLETW